MFVRGVNRAGSSQVQCRERDAGAGVFVGDLNKGRTQSGSVQGPRCGLRSDCRGLEQGQDPAWFSAGTEMWAQDYLSVS